MERRTALWIQVAIGYCFPLVLHLCSFFSQRWVIKDGMAKGLFYQCADSDTAFSECSLNLIDQATIGLEGTALVLAMLACVSSIMSVGLYGPDRTDDIDNDESCCYTWNCLYFYCCSISMYPITGILMLSGCIRFGTLYPTEVLGGSFYACIIAGCLHLVVIFVCCCDALCKSRRDEFVFETFTKELYSDV